MTVDEQENEELQAELDQAAELLLRTLRFLNLRTDLDTTGLVTAQRRALYDAIHDFLVERKRKGRDE